MGYAQLSGVDKAQRFNFKGIALTN